MSKLTDLMGLGVPGPVAEKLTNAVLENGATITGAATVSTTLAVTGASTLTGLVTCVAGLKTKQDVSNVHDTVPTAASLTSAFGDPATLGRGFIATIDDADGDTNGYLVFTSDASWYFLKFTKAA